MPSASTVPPGFVDLREVLPHALFAIHYASEHNFTGAPVPGYELPGAWLRAEAVPALLRAEVELARAGLGLLVYDAYRPLRATQHLAAWCRRHAPHLLQGYVSEHSRHSKGLSIDLGLTDLATGEVLDMGGPWDSFDERATTLHATGEPLERRLLLRAAMMGQGFDDYRREWWHFEWLPHEGFDFVDVPYGI